MTADAQVKWKRLFPKWSTKFLLDPADPKSGTWLDSKWSQGLSVGCKCCNAAERICPFGVYGVASADALQVVNFTKHAASGCSGRIGGSSGRGGGSGGQHANSPGRAWPPPPNLGGGGAAAPGGSGGRD